VTVNSVAIDITVAGRLYRVTGTVHLGTTNSRGDDPDEVSSWTVSVGRPGDLLSAIGNATERTPSECVEWLELELIAAARGWAQWGAIS